MDSATADHSAMMGSKMDNFLEQFGQDNRRRGYQKAAADVCCQATVCGENSASGCDRGQADPGHQSRRSTVCLIVDKARKTSFCYQWNK